MAIKELTTKSYYKLTYSVIPDNKIQQIVGTYVQYIYDTYTDIISDIYDSYTYTYKDGHTDTGVLPMYNSNVQDYYEDVYYEDVTYERSTSVGYETANRTEKVAVEYTLTVLNDVPFEFNDISLTEVTGKLETRTGTNQTGTDTFWTWFSNDKNMLFAPACINMVGGGTTSVEDLTTGEIKDYEIDSVWNGKKLDGDKYRMDLVVRVYTINNTLYRHEKLSGIDATISQGLISSFKINVSILGVRTETVDFEKHVDTPNYADYPLRIDGNEYTNLDTRLNYNVHVVSRNFRLVSSSGIPIIYFNKTGYSVWSDWISNQILSKYKSGKIFINAKIKLKYVLDNELHIDSEVTIKDINNHYISRKYLGVDVTCIFKVKNIEYVCDDKEYVANVILLEDRLVPYENYVVTSNNIKVVDSNNINVKIHKEEI